MPVSKGEWVGLFFLTEVGVSVVLQRDVEGRVGLGVGQGCCVANSGVAGLCLPGVGSPLQMQMGQASLSALCMAPSTGKNLGHIVRLCPCLQLRSSEKLLPIPLFCIVATAVVWAAALYFFFQTLSSWEVNFPFCCPVHLLSSFLPVVPFTQKNTLGKSLGLLMESWKGLTPSADWEGSMGSCAEPKMTICMQL